MATTRDILKASLRKIGVLTKTDDPSADEMQDALFALNTMLDSWANDSLTVPYRVSESFNLSGGVQDYTIGAGGDFDTVRPVNIISVFVREGTSDETLIKINDDVFSSISFKSSGGQPSYFNYTNAHPLGVLRFYPVPTGSEVVHILSEKQLTNLGLSDTVTLPVGWNRAIIYNLGIDLAPEYGMDVSQTHAKVAMESLGQIRRTISRNRPLDAQPLSSNIDNIYNGYNE